MGNRKKNGYDPWTGTLSALVKLPDDPRMASAARSIRLALGGALLGGVLAVLCPPPYRSIGLLIVWLAAAGSLGLIMGFLFGIPRSRKAGGDAPAAGANDAALFSTNTNLEDISDWLTKIIVGATLVELRPIASSVWRVATQIDVFGDGSSAGASLVVGVALAAFLAGFIHMYLWTRVSSLQLFTRAAQDAQKPSRQRRPSPVPVGPANRGGPGGPGSAPGGDAGPVPFGPGPAVAPIVRRDLHFDFLANPTVEPAQTPRERAAGRAPWFGWQTTMSEAEMFATDFNKGQFGGSGISLDGNRIVEATWETPPADAQSLLVRLTVRVTSPNAPPLTGNVRFYFHPSFDQPIVTSVADGQQASAELDLVEAFTVGIECDDGKTVLELDLSELPDFPPRFIANAG